MIALQCCVFLLYKAEHQPRVHICPPTPLPVITERRDEPRLCSSSPLAGLSPVYAAVCFCFTGGAEYTATLCPHFVSPRFLLCVHKSILYVCVSNLPCK